MGTTHRGWSALAVGLLPVLLVACSADRFLLVDLRTNVPRGDFDRVEVALMTGTETFTVPPTSASLVPDDLSSVRVAHFADLPAGDAYVEVSLLLDAQLVARGQALVALQDSELTTVVVAAECGDVVCPGIDNVCVGGRCTTARCTPETPSFCPPPDCTTSTDCAPADGCDRVMCVGGACLTAFGTDCDAGPPDAGPPDAGPPDAGPPDAGPDPEWDTAPFGACSVECGTGTETRAVTCQDAQGRVVEDTQCAGPRPSASQPCSPTCDPPSGRRVGSWNCINNDRTFYSTFEFRRETCVAGSCVEETVRDQLECVCYADDQCSLDAGCGENLWAAESGCDDPDVSGDRTDCPFVGYNYADPGCIP